MARPSTPTPGLFGKIMIRLAPFLALTAGVATWQYAYADTAANASSLVAAGVVLAATCLCYLGCWMVTPGLTLGAFWNSSFDSFFGGDGDGDGGD